MIITLQQKEFIDTYFHENIHESELSIDDFSKLTTAEELHYLSQQHNWDNGVKILQWIVESSICSEATALEIFWLAQPHDFQAYKLDKILKNNSQNEVLKLIKTILEHYPNQFYQKTAIHFDPKPLYEGNYSVPDFMKEATKGEESYVYYEEDDVEDWFEADWEKNIQRANSTIELFNIAYFIEEPEQADLILKHPLCDRGIATLVFWRLYNACSMYVDTPKMRAAIANKIKSNLFPEIVAYNPKTDPKVKINSQKVAWEIPQCMKETI